MVVGILENHVKVSNAITHHPARKAGLRGKIIGGKNGILVFGLYMGPSIFMLAILLLLPHRIILSIPDMCLEP